MFTPDGQESSSCTSKPRKPRQGAQGNDDIDIPTEAHTVKHNFFILPSSTKIQKAQLHLT
jgi:hypothetical protein